jgi:asparagine synthase (glutamine-hydrolysing)
MCGINGIFAYGGGSPAVDEGELLRSRDAMTLRGPDAAGLWRAPHGRVGFGHRRLSIIDLSEQGRQPMTTDDGRYTIVFNGEIYNYPHLRDELVAQGVRFRGHSDTEVILHLYARDGAAMLGRLRGMFAFAIWDQTAQRLFLARDPYGIKPLYYADQGGQLRFASQVKALLAGGHVARELDPGGVAGFLLWGSVPEPLTLYRDVRMLPAGSSVTVDAAGMQPTERFWTVGAAIARSVQAAADLPAGEEASFFREAMRDSMRAHLVADVPVGAFLSAGLDSSTLLGLASELSGQSVECITFTCDEFQGKPTDELPLARVVAAHYGARHHTVSITTQDMESDLPRFLAAMDQPTIDGINTWFVSQAAARTGLKVVLSGLGGDELLGGYSTFSLVPRQVQRSQSLARIPGLAGAWETGGRLLARLLPSFDPRRAAALSLGKTYFGAYQLQRGLLMPWQLDAVVDPEFARIGLTQLYAAEIEGESPDPGKAALDGFARVSELESVRYMRNQLLRDTDWAGMGHSLEIRTPLVDSRLAEQVSGLAATGRLGPAKTMLSRTLERPLPTALLNRPKTGFTVPIWKWLRHARTFDAWRRVSLLQRSQVHDYTRWGYSVLAQLPEARSVLK